MLDARSAPKMGFSTNAQHGNLLLPHYRHLTRSINHEPCALSSEIVNFRMRPRSMAKEFAGLYCLLAVFMLVLFCLSSCQLPSSPPVPNATNIQKSVSKAILSAIQPVAGIPITLTFDVPETNFDGILVSAGYKSDVYYLVQAFAPSNTFTVILPTNQPSYVQVQTYTLWPFPYVQTPYTNDDGSTGVVTNMYQLSEPSWTIFTPTNCPRIGIFTMADGSIQVAGWSPSTNLVVQSSSNLVDWMTVTNISQSGAWEMAVDGSQSHLWFRAVSQP